MAIRWSFLSLALFAGLAVMIAAPSVRAVEPDEILKDAVLEARARNLSAGLRCLVCQNQSIDGSNAPLARDLRLLVWERQKAGDSNADVLQFLVARYGEIVLLQPRFSRRTVILWLAPVFQRVGFPQHQLLYGFQNNHTQRLSPGEEPRRRFPVLT